MERSTVKQIWNQPVVWMSRRKNDVEIEWSLYPARLSDEADVLLIREFIDDYYWQTQLGSKKSLASWGPSAGSMRVREKHADEILARLMHFLSDHRFHHVWDEPWLDVPEFMKPDIEAVWAERLAKVKDEFPGDFGDNPLVGFNAASN